MKKRNFRFQSSDGKNRIHAVMWIPDGKPRAIVQLVHGMQEYIERYEGFAEYLTSHNILVVGHDHLGHGQSVESVEDWGYVGEENPSDLMVHDINRVRLGMEKQYPDIPYFLLGHSMGSYLVRKYLSYKGEGLAGSIIVGTGQETDAVSKAGLLMIKTLTKAKGSRYRSNLIQNMTFTTPYQKYDLFGKDPENSWVCSDPKVMEKYYSDPRCNFTFTLNGYEALVSTVLFDNIKSNIDKIPKDLPILITSGMEDPVGNLGEGVKYVYEKYVKAGISDIECKLYPGVRHEILNEVIKDEVYENIYNWIEARM